MTGEHNIVWRDVIHGQPVAVPVVLLQNGSGELLVEGLQVNITNGQCVTLWANQFLNQGEIFCLTVNTKSTTEH